MRHATEPLAVSCSDAIGSPLPGTAHTEAAALPRLSTAVAEAPRDFRFTYSLRDIHNLAFLSADERQAVRSEWKAWHRRHASMGPFGVVGWVAGAALAWACSFGAASTTAAIAAVTGWQVPLATLYAAAGVMAVSLLVAAPLLFSTLASAALEDAYVAGYADGVIAGVNRSLQITPEREQEMWGELHAAASRDLRAVRAAAAVSPARPSEAVPPHVALP